MHCRLGGWLRWSRLYRWLRRNGLSNRLCGRLHRSWLYDSLSRRCLYCGLGLDRLCGRLRRSWRSIGGKGGGLR